MLKQGNHPVQLVQNHSKPYSMPWKFLPEPRRMTLRTSENLWCWLQPRYFGKPLPMYRCHCSYQIPEHSSTNFPQQSCFSQTPSFNVVTADADWAHVVEIHRLLQSIQPKRGLLRSISTFCRQSDCNQPQSCLFNFFLLFILTGTGNSIGFLSLRCARIYYLGR